MKQRPTTKDIDRFFYIKTIFLSQDYVRLPLFIDVKFRFDSSGKSVVVFVVVFFLDYSKLYETYYLCIIAFLLEIGQMMT